MPEGDTIFRAAARLRPVLDGQRIQSAAVWRDAFSAEPMEGRDVASVEARGKHLLIHLDDRSVVHTHLGMTGSWHVYRRGDAWTKPARWAALTLETEDWIVVCFSPKTLEHLSESAFRRHRWLSRLGPDILAASFDQDESLRRFKLLGPTPIGEAVMNQTLVCGIGNVYKSEVLFLERVEPFIAVESLTTEELRRILVRARKLLRKNVGEVRRRTRHRADGRRHWVYGRGGQPCYECGETILLRRQGDLGRATYWCAACQRDKDRPPAQRMTSVVRTPDV